MKTNALTAVAAATVLGVAVLAPSGASAEQDFSRLTNEELVQQRAQVRSMSEADRARFREEMQKRVPSMNAEERERLGIGGRGQGTQDDTTRPRTNEDNDRGQGEMKRERRRTESGDGYGRGYEARQGGGMGSAGMGGGRGGMGGGRRGR